MGLAPWISNSSSGVGGSCSRGSTAGAPTTTSIASRLPFYPEKGLELLPSFRVGSLGTQAVVAREKLLLSTRKKWDLAAVAATFLSLLPKPFSLKLPRVCGLGQLQGEGPWQLQREDGYAHSQVPLFLGAQLQLLSGC